MSLYFAESSWSPPAELPCIASAGAKRAAIDVETRDLDLDDLGPGARRGAEVVGLSVAVDGARWYLPMRHPDSGCFDPPAVARWWAEEVAPLPQIVGANVLYDLDMLAEAGMTTRAALDDVLNMAALLDENQDDMSLDGVAGRLLGRGKDEALMREAAASIGVAPDKVKANIWRLPARFVGPYAEADAELPLLLHDRLRELLVKERDERLPKGALDCYDEVERPLLPILLAMRRRGARFDVDGAHLAIDRLRAMEHNAQIALDRAAGRHVEATKPDQIAKYLDAEGIEYPRTAKGSPSFVKEWLDAHPSEAVRRIRGVRKLKKAQGDVAGLLRHVTRGRIHACFHPLGREEGGTTVGRFSSSDPNLQNQNARDPEIMPIVRGLFLPEDGERFESVDWSQIQFRLLTHYATGDGSDEAREMYRRDRRTDFHKMCAEMAGIDPDDKVKRKRVKNVNFGKVFGAGAETLAAQMGCAVPEAEEFCRQYDAKLPWVGKTLRKVAAAARERGHVTTLSGRRRRFDRWEPEGWRRGKTLKRADAEREWPGKTLQRAATHAALACLMQGGEGDVMKRAMIELDSQGILDVLGAPLLTVHDELGFSRPQDDDGELALLEVVRIMETTTKLRVPVLADRKGGANWGECV